MPIADSISLVDRLRLMTWNVHSCRSARMEPTLSLVAEVIETSRAAVIALQEVDVGCQRTGGADQAEDIGRQLQMNSHFCCLVDWQHFPYSAEPEGQYGLAFLCHPELGPIQSSFSLLPVLSPASEPRGVFQLEVEWNGLSLAILNTHLSVQRRERACQLWALHQRVVELQKSGSVPILMGDFNVVGTSTALRALRRAVRECLPQRPPRGTFPSRLPLLRLDRIFVGAELGCSAARIVASPESRRASDHLPVYAELIS